MNNDNVKNDNSNMKNYYPASITILLNTRILGHTKTIYYPNMTLPSISSKTVYFNPLIKLDKRIVQTIPKGKKEDFIYEQFFSPSYFNSLLIRSQYYPQPKRTLEQATEQGIIDNNIKIMLDTLFNANKPFYIDKKRYTSYGYTWNKGDWIIESTNSSKIIKKFYNYYQTSSSNYPRTGYTNRYNVPTATVQTIMPSAPMIMPTTTTLYQPNQLLYPTIGQSNLITYQTPILQSYPYQNVMVPNANENPMFDSFNKFEESVDENILHGSSASSTFGDIIDEQQKTKQQKKPRMTADKLIASQGQTQQQPMSQPPKNPLSVINNTINQPESEILKKQYLFYALDGFKNGFINANRINCSAINTVDQLKTINRGAFYDYKIEPWSVLSNDGNGDCLFYVFCQIVNSPDYKTINSVLKTRQNEFKTGDKNIAYYDSDGNYTVAGLRNIVADFILYNIDYGVDIGDSIISRYTNEPDDRYIVSGNLNQTLDNMRICADKNNRALSKQKALPNNNYYWGDQTAINIIEYVFKFKTIIIHKPNQVNRKTEVYNDNDKVTINFKNNTVINSDYVEIEYYTDNTQKNSVIESGYLIDKQLDKDGYLQSVTILKNNNMDLNTCEFEKKLINNDNNNTIITIHKIEKYKIYNSDSFTLLRGGLYKNYVYILNHDRNHYETVSFFIRGNMCYVFNNNDIFAFHPYIIYMIFLYAFMIGRPLASPFSKTTLNQYLEQLYRYYSSNTKIKNRLLLGGAGDGSPIANPMAIASPRANPMAIASPRANPMAIASPVTTPSSTPISTPRVTVSTPTSNPTSTPTSTPSTSYYSQFKNYVNNKLDQPLTIKDSNKTTPFYYANPNLSYYVVVNLELFPGDKISDLDKRNLGCQIKFDNIRKSYADLLGYQYQPSLLNTNVMPSKIDNSNSSSTSSSRKSTSTSNNNSTKKNGNGNNDRNRDRKYNNRKNDKNGNRSTRKYRG